MDKISLAPRMIFCNSGLMYIDFSYPRCYPPQNYSTIVFFKIVRDDNGKIKKVCHFDTHGVDDDGAEEFLLKTMAKLECEILNILCQDSNREYYAIDKNDKIQFSLDPSDLDDLIDCTDSPVYEISDETFDDILDNIFREFGDISVLEQEGEDLEERDNVRYSYYSHLDAVKDIETFKEVVECQL